MPRLLPVLILLPACAWGGAPHVTVDGSSTVYPITEAVAEVYALSGAERRVTVGVSGTGGGMKKLCEGQVDLIGASRPIKESELERCEAHGIEVIELPIAMDGVAVVVHPEARWVEAMSVEELARVWEPAAQGRVLRWSDVRPEWPDAELHLFGPGVDSGTYDYFTAAVVGEEHASRGDFTSSEDDNVLVAGISRDTHGLGFFGLAFYLENQDKVRALGVAPADGDDPVWPSAESVRTGAYQPLSRPVFLYVNASALAAPQVEGFVDFYLRESAPLVEEVGYVPLSEALQGLVRGRFDAGVTGSVLEGGSKPGADLAALLEAG